ncbi:TIGR03085 family metal-binding protein [Brevibacterium daeguense]|uniref:TIGR03085 family metal-binding protein n=1 Tax=Brevibacterium daeguense TaxID=909936 RepID=A0ABP8EKW9_9MICO|nr:TIGR03085 family metal-binding protein [Brevibacterium daeguense]
MTNHARTERLALAALLRELGPDQPTLCEGWDTRDLAVHLVIRDRKPLASIGNIAPEVAGRIPALGRRAQQAEDELHALPWAQLVGLVAEGSPKWNPMAWGPIDRLMNTSELLVHHEDVRRAQLEWQPRELSWELHGECFRMLQAMILPFSLRAGRRYLLEAPGFGTVSAGPTARGTVRLHGSPVELLLYLFGREDHARVEVSEESQVHIDAE